jgi:oligosaccharide repeat unit polymerase
MTRYLVNPLLLFLAVWGTAVALYAGGLYAGTFPAPQSALWAAVLLNVGGFSLGYLTWAAFQSRRPPASSKARVEGVSPSDRGRDARDTALFHADILSPDKIARLLQFTGLMGLAALSLGVYRTAVIASQLGTSFHGLLTDPGMLRVGFAMFVTAGVFETSWIVMLNSITSGLFSIGFVLLGVLLHVDSGRRKYFYLCGFLLITLAIGLTSVSRYEVTVNIVYMVFAYCLVRGLNGRQQESQMPRQWQMGRPSASSRLPLPPVSVLLPLVAAAVLFFIIDILLRKSAEYGRPDRLQGFVYHLFWYLASPLAAFNEFLTTFDSHYHLGQCTFFPFYKWLSRFHLAPEADISVFGEFVVIPYVANVYTYLRNFYEDFGMIGVVTVPYVLGLATSALRARAGGYFPYLNLYLVLLVFILFSFYNFFLFSNQVYLQILFGFLFFRYRLPAWDD